MPKLNINNKVWRFNHVARIPAIEQNNTLSDGHEGVLTNRKAHRIDPYVFKD
jgi:hypothetical protein